MDSVIQKAISHLFNAYSDDPFKLVHQLISKSFTKFKAALPLCNEDEFNPQDSPESLQETCELFLKEV